MDAVVGASAAGGAEATRAGAAGAGAGGVAGRGAEASALATCGLRESGALFWAAGADRCGAGAGCGGVAAALGDESAFWRDTCVGAAALPI